MLLSWTQLIIISYLWQRSIISRGFKYSLMSSDGNNRVIGFSLDDSLLMDYDSVMHSTKMRTDIIALEDSNKHSIYILSI